MPAPSTRGRPSGRHRLRGFSLVELCVVMGIATLIVSLVWPSQQQQLQRARRIDAIAALNRLQMAQEAYRARHGIYSAQLAGLSGAGSVRSADGWYELALRDAAGETVTLAARALPDRAQHADQGCREITLRLNQGLADAGPSSRCWNQ